MTASPASPEKPPEKPAWAAWLDPRSPEFKRLKEQAPPVAPGFALPLGPGAAVLGFHPVDYAGAQPLRWLGPDPKAILFFGKRDPAAKTLSLALEIPAGVGELRLFWNEAALAPEPTAEGLAAALPPDDGAEVSALRLRLDRTVAQGGRLVGLALCAVAFS